MCFKGRGLPCDSKARYFPFGDQVGSKHVGYSDTLQYIDCHFMHLMMTIENLHNINQSPIVSIPSKTMNDVATDTQSLISQSRNEVC